MPAIIFNLRKGIDPLNMEEKADVIIVGDTEYDHAEHHDKIIPIICRHNVKVIILHIGSSQLKVATGKHLYLNGLIDILNELWGPALPEKPVDNIIRPDLHVRNNIDKDLLKVLEAIEGCRGYQLTESSRKHVFKNDIYLPKHKLIIEFDEDQHMTLMRAASLKAYPENISLGYDKQRWIELSEIIQAGDNAQKLTDEKRAFYDSVRDIMSVKLGYKPIVRIYEKDVKWNTNEAKSDRALEILWNIERIINSK